MKRLVRKTMDDQRPSTSSNAPASPSPSMLPQKLRDEWRSLQADSKEELMKPPNSRSMLPLVHRWQRLIAAADAAASTTLGHAGEVVKICMDAGEVAEKAQEWDDAAASFHRAHLTLSVFNRGVQDAVAMIVCLRGISSAQLGVAAAHKETPARTLKCRLAWFNTLACSMMLRDAQTDASGADSAQLQHALIKMGGAAEALQDYELALDMYKRNYALKKAQNVPTIGVEKHISDATVRLEDQRRTQGAQWPEVVSAMLGAQVDEQRQRDEATTTALRVLLGLKRMERSQFGVLQAKRPAHAAATVSGGDDSAAEVFRRLADGGKAAVQAKQLGEAEAQYRRALQLAEQSDKILPKDRVVVLGSLGFVHCMQAQSDTQKGSADYKRTIAKAVPLYREALATIAELRKGQSDDRTLMEMNESALMQLGVVACNVERPEAGMHLLQRCRASKLRRNTDTAQVDKHIAAVERTLARRDQELMHRGQQKLATRGSTVVLAQNITLNDAVGKFKHGKQLVQEKQFADAEDDLLAAMKAFELLSESHPQLLTRPEYRQCLSTSAAMYYALGQKAKGTPNFELYNEIAVHLYKKAHTILQQVNANPDDASFAPTEFNLACGYVNLGRYASASTHFTHCRDVKSKNAQDTTSVDNNLMALGPKAEKTLDSVEQGNINSAGSFVLSPSDQLTSPMNRSTSFALGLEQSTAVFSPVASRAASQARLPPRRRSEDDLEFTLAANASPPKADDDDAFELSGEAADITARKVASFAALREKTRMFEHTAMVERKRIEGQYVRASLALMELQEGACRTVLDEAAAAAPDLVLRSGQLQLVYQEHRSRSYFYSDLLQQLQLVEAALRAAVGLRDGAFRLHVGAVALVGLEDARRVTLCRTADAAVLAVMTDVLSAQEAAARADLERAASAALQAASDSVAHSRVLADEGQSRLSIAGDAAAVRGEIERQYVCENEAVVRVAHVTDASSVTMQLIAKVWVDQAALHHLECTLAHVDVVCSAALSIAGEAESVERRALAQRADRSCQAAAECTARGLMMREEHDGIGVLLGNHVTASEAVARNGIASAGNVAFVGLLANREAYLLESAEDGARRGIAEAESRSALAVCEAARECSAMHIATLEENARAAAAVHACIEAEALLRRPLAVFAEAEWLELQANHVRSECAVAALVEGVALFVRSQRVRVELAEQGDRAILTRAAEQSLHSRQRDHVESAEHVTRAELLCDGLVPMFATMTTAINDEEAALRTQVTRTEAEARASALVAGFADLLVAVYRQRANAIDEDNMALRRQIEDQRLAGAFHELEAVARTRLATEEDDCIVALHHSAALAHLCALEAAERSAQHASVFGAWRCDALLQAASLHAVVQFAKAAEGVLRGAETHCRHELEQLASLVPAHETAASPAQQAAAVYAASLRLHADAEAAMAACDAEWLAGAETLWRDWHNEQRAHAAHKVLAAESRARSVLEADQVSFVQVFALPDYAALLLRWHEATVAAFASRAVIELSALVDVALLDRLEVHERADIREAFAATGGSLLLLAREADARCDMTRAEAAGMAALEAMQVETVVEPLARQRVEEPFQAACRDAYHAAWSDMACDHHRAHGVELASQCNVLSTELTERAHIARVAEQTLRRVFHDEDARIACVGAEEATRRGMLQRHSRSRTSRCVEVLHVLQERDALELQQAAFVEHEALQLAERTAREATARRSLTRRLGDLHNLCVRELAARTRLLRAEAADANRVRRGNIDDAEADRRLTIAAEELTVRAELELVALSHLSNIECGRIFLSGSERQETLHRVLIERRQRAEFEVVSLSEQNARRVPATGLPPLIGAKTRSRMSRRHLHALAAADTVALQGEEEVAVRTRLNRADVFRTTLDEEYRRDVQRCNESVAVVLLASRFMADAHELLCAELLEAHDKPLVEAAFDLMMASAIAA